MAPSDLLKDSLQRETERQNRIYQEAIARKKNPVQQGLAEEARIESQAQFTNKTSIDTGVAGMPDIASEFALPRDVAGVPPVEAQAAPASSASHEAPVVASEPAPDIADRLSHIPEIRSALMPPDASVQEGAWSKPFSLTRPDMEPWLSFYKGYRQSRLFREGAENTAFDPSSGAPLDFAVLALLELRQADPKLLLDPPVRINGPVRYAELEEDLRACRNEQEARFLIERAAQAHEAQLHVAIDRGREMGNLLYDALMGEGHSNLIKAWQDAYQRKPTIEELHLMLTAGRTKPATSKRPQAVAEREERTDEEKPVAPAVVQLAPQEQPAKPVMSQKEMPRERVAPKEAPEMPRPAKQEVRVKPAPRGKVSWLEKKLDALSPRQRFLVPIVVAAACSAVLIALGLNGLI